MSSPDEPTDPHAQKATDLVTSHFTDIPEPTDRARAAGAMLGAIPHLQARLREIRQTAVQELRAGGMSHGDVAKELGISRGRAQQIAEGRSESAKSRRASRTLAEPDA